MNTWCTLYAPLPNRHAFIFKPSGYIALYLVAVTLGAVAIGMHLPFSIPGKWAMGLLLAGWGAYAYWTWVALASPRSVQRLDWQGEQGWLIGATDGAYRAHWIPERSFRSPNWMWLCFQTEGTHMASLHVSPTSVCPIYHVLVFRDSLSAADFKTLYLLLTPAAKNW